MKRIGIMALCLAGGLALSASLRAEDAVLPGNPYAVVVVRNIFGLNPPPAIDTNAVVVEPPVKIIPNGIMTILGQLQVLFKVAAKPGGKDASYMLTEGQRQDDIEVIKINEKAAVVTFNNHGIMQELPLVVTAPSSTPVAAPTGGNPGFPGIAPGIAPGNTGINPFNNRFGNRGAQGGNNQNGGNNNSGGGGNNGSNMRNVPTRGGNQGLNQQNNLSTEETMIMTVAAKAKAIQDNSPAAPIFPPTPLDDEAGIPSNLAPPPTPGGSTAH